MSGHHSFDELMKDFSEERRSKIDAKKAMLRLDTALHEVREIMKATQASVAASMNVQQPAIAKLENRNDMLLSTMNAYVMALGGKLQVSAVFEDDIVFPLMGFGEIEKDNSESKARS